MRITYLVEDSSRIWGGVKAAFDAANALHARGHAVTIVSKSAPPSWMNLACGFQRSAAFAPTDIPASDIVVATYWTTVQAACDAHRGAVVHYCQGYEGDHPEAAPHRARIDGVYASAPTHLVTISPHLASMLRRRFGREVSQVPYAIDHDTMFQGAERAPSRPLRVGLVGPYQVTWKDIRTGIDACRLAHRAGLDLVLVRVSNTGRHPDEAALDIPTEWHECVPPRDMGRIYRSLDVLLGTSRGEEEGFFLPAVEAMACGVPCVLTEIPCFRGYGELQHALFVEPRRPDQMAEALVLAAGHAGLRSDLRRNGIATAARYTMREHVTALERVFAELVAERGEAIESAQQEPGNDLATGIARAARRAASGCATLEELDALQARVAAAFGAEVAHRRGLLSYAAGDFDGARRNFAAALGATTSPAEVQNDFGVACFAVGAVEDARRAFERALAADPGHADARANLAALTTRR